MLLVFSVLFARCCFALVCALCMSGCLCACLGWFVCLFVRKCCFYAHLLAGLSFLFAFRFVCLLCLFLLRLSVSLLVCSYVGFVYVFLRGLRLLVRLFGRTSDLFVRFLWLVCAGWFDLWVCLLCFVCHACLVCGFLCLLARLFIRLNVCSFICVFNFVWHRSCCLVGWFDGFLRFVCMRYFLFTLCVLLCVVCLLCSIYVFCLLSVFCLVCLLWFVGFLWVVLPSKSCHKSTLDVKSAKVNRGIHVKSIHHQSNINNPYS